MTRNSTTILRAAASTGAILIAVVHQYAPKQVDLLTIGLIILAFLPWLAPIIKSIEITGLGKIELKVDQVKEQVEGLQFLISGFVTQYGIIHLEKLAANGPFPYVKGKGDRDRFANEIIRLKEFGLVRKLIDYTLYDIPDSGDLKKYVVLTERGRKYLELRAKIKSDNRQE